MSETKFTPPRIIDFENVSEFKTEKHTYKVFTDSISIDRFSVMQQKEVECLGYYSLVKPLEFQNELTKAFNAQNYAYLGKLLYDRTYFYHFDKKAIHPILEFCSVFIYREDEDAGVYDAKLAKEKIEDWKKSNLDILPFFTLSIKVSPTLSKAYNNFIQNISEKGLKQTMGETSKE